MCIFKSKMKNQEKTLIQDVKTEGKIMSMPIVIIIVAMKQMVDFNLHCFGI